jgi:hypothetical protein
MTVKNIVFTLAAVFTSAVFAQQQTDYRKMAMAEPDEEGSAPLASKWQADNAKALEEATKPCAVAKFVESAENAAELLSRVKGAYETDVLDAYRIAAVTRYVMAKDGDARWLQFWKQSKADARKIWAQALLSTAIKATDEYVAVFCLDQLRWCGCASQVPRVEALKTVAKTQMLKSYCDRVVRELNRSCPGLD